MITLRKVTLILIALVLLGAQAATAAPNGTPAPGKSHGAATKGMSDGNRGHEGRGMSDGN